MILRLIWGSHKKDRKKENVLCLLILDHNHIHHHLYQQNYDFSYGILVGSDPLLPEIRILSQYNHGYQTAFDLG